MKLTTMKRPQTPEKYIRHAASITNLLLQSMHYLMGLFSIITTCFAASIISAAKALLEQPDTLLSPSQYYELILQAWDNGMDIAFNVGLIYVAVCYVELGLKYWLKRRNRTHTTLDAQC